MQDPAAFADARPGQGVQRLRRTLRWLAVATGLTSFTALIFATMLAITMPASFLRTLVALPPQVETLSGSVWRGRATLSGGHVVDWRVSLRELWLGRLVADATFDGPDTRLEGVLGVSPWQVSARDWTGRAGPGLLALAPRLAVASCSTSAVVAVERLALGRDSAVAKGEIGIAEGTCADRSGREHPVPAMTLRLSTDGSGALAALSRSGATEAPLAQVTVTGDRRLLVRIEPEGAALVPGMPASAPTILEYPF